MNIISADNISKSFSDKWLFRNMSFGVSQGEKVALVGVNGTGKSTFLNVLAGVITADEGSVSVRKGIRVGVLSQNPQFDDNITVWQAIFQAENDTLAAIRLYEKALKSGNDKDLHDAIEKIDALNAWDYESQIEQILGKLGVPEPDALVKTLSGGQKKRVALAKLLLQEADLLILDEPTNHLDVEAVEWLEEWLTKQNTTLILVTHDRYFLDSIANVIVELDNGQLFRYQGNYSYFLEKKDERIQNLTIETDKARSLMRKELEWIRRQPKARGTKAKYRVEAFEGIKEKAGVKIETGANVTINVGMARIGKKILETENLFKSFGDTKILSDFSYFFKKGDRIGIVGPNGVGKSTFLDIITGKVQIDSGVMEKGENTLFGYYSQQELNLPEEKRVIEAVRDIAEVMKTGTGQVITASQLLTHFNFPPAAQYKYVATLSGGEKRRLQLLQVLVKNPNFLILDEPTNDLDLLTLNVLEDFLENFDGCLLIVSHDRYFMDRLVDHLFVFEGEGMVRDFTGNYSDYKNHLKEQKSISADQKTKTKSIDNTPQVVENKEKKKLSFKEIREYETLDQEIPLLENKKAGIYEQMLAESVSHHDRAILGREFTSVEDEIEQKTKRWLELSELI